jgi:hypothetical protein
VYCLGSLIDEKDYAPCDEEEDNLTEVLQFQVIVAAIGSLAFWAAQQRKKRTRTLFESRKYSASQGF